MDADYMMTDEASSSIGASSSQSTSASFAFSDSPGDTSVSSYGSSSSHPRVDKGKRRALSPNEGTLALESPEEHDDAITPASEPITYVIEGWREASSQTQRLCSLLSSKSAAEGATSTANSTTRSRLPVPSARRQAQRVSYSASSTASSTRATGSNLAEHDHVAIFGGLHQTARVASSTSLPLTESVPSSSSSIKRTFSQAEITPLTSPDGSPASPATSSSQFPSQRRFYSNRISRGVDTASRAQGDSIMAELDRHDEESRREQLEQSANKRLRPDNGSAGRSVSAVSTRAGDIRSQSIARSVHPSSPTDDSHLIPTVDHLVNDSATSTSIFPPALGSLSGSTSARQPLRFRESASSSFSHLPESIRTTLPDSLRTTGLPDTLRTTMLGEPRTSGVSGQPESLTRASSSSSSASQWSWQRGTERSIPTDSAVANTNWAEASSSAIAATLFGAPASSRNWSGSSLSQRWTFDPNPQATERARANGIPSPLSVASTYRAGASSPFESVMAELEVPSLPPWATMTSSSDAYSPGGEADWVAAFPNRSSREPNWMRYDADAPSSSSTGGSTGHGDTASAVSTSIDATVPLSNGLRAARLRSTGGTPASVGSEVESDRDLDGDIHMRTPTPTSTSGSSMNVSSSASSSTVPRRAQLISSLRSARERPSDDSIQTRLTQIQAEVTQTVYQLRDWRDRNNALITRIRRREAATEALLDPQPSAAAVASSRASAASSSRNSNVGDVNSSFESAMRRFAELDAADRQRESSEAGRALLPRPPSVGSASRTRSTSRETSPAVEPDRPSMSSMAAVTATHSRSSQAPSVGLWGELRNARAMLDRNSSDLASRSTTTSSIATAAPRAEGEPALTASEADGILRRPGALDSSGRLRGPTRLANQSWLGLGDEVDRAVNTELASSNGAQPRTGSRIIRHRPDLSLLNVGSTWSSSSTYRPGDAPVAGAPQLPTLRARSPLVVPFTSGEASGGSSAAPSSNSTATDPLRESLRSRRERPNRQDSEVMTPGASLRTHLRPLTLSSRLASSPPTSLGSSINQRSHHLLDAMDEEVSSSSSSSAEAHRQRRTPFLLDNRFPNGSSTAGPRSTDAETRSIASYISNREPSRDASRYRGLDAATARSAALNDAARAARRQPVEMREPAPAPAQATPQRCSLERAEGSARDTRAAASREPEGRPPWVGADAPILAYAGRGDTRQRRSETPGELGLRRADVNERIDTLASQVHSTRQRRQETTLDSETQDHPAQAVTLNTQEILRARQAALEAIISAPSSSADLAHYRTSAILEDTIARSREARERERRERARRRREFEESRRRPPSNDDEEEEIEARGGEATSSEAVRRMLRLEEDLDFDRASSRDFGTFFLEQSEDGQFSGAQLRLRIARELAGFRSLGGLASDPNNYLDDAEWARQDSYEDLLRLSARMGEAMPKNTPTHVIEAMPTCVYSVWLGGSCADSQLASARPEAIDPLSKGKGVDRSGALEAAALRELEARAAIASRDAHCPICLDEYEPSSLLRSTPCKHAFHSNCLSIWLKENRTCPLCRSDCSANATAKLSTTAEAFRLPLLPELDM